MSGPARRCCWAPCVLGVIIGEKGDLATRHVAGWARGGRGVKTGSGGKVPDGLMRLGAMVVVVCGLCARKLCRNFLQS